MSLEFKTIDSKITLFVMNDFDLDYFKSAYLDAFNSKYSNLFDQHSTFRLYDNHLRYLYELLKNDYNKTLRL